MTKIQSTKKALIASTLSLFLCFTMLIGTTFAWFTDSVTSAGNVIKTGNLDVEMYWADGTADPTADDTVWTDASTGAIFNNDKWEPGYVEVHHIKIANEGTLALKYKVSIIADGEVSDLANVIDVYYADPAVQVDDRSDLAGATKLGTLAEVLAALGETGNGVLAEGKSDTVTLALAMQDGAGNEYMNKSIGSSFAIQLLATQANVENDSFGNGYDDGATYPNVSVPTTVPADTTQVVVLSSNGMKVDVPAAALPAGTTSVTLAYTTPNVDTQNNTVTYNSIELLDQNGVVIDLEGNTAPISVVLPAQTAFNAGSVVFIYHDGEFVATATVDADGTIPYSATHFCEVVVSDEYDGESIDVATGETLAGLSACDLNGKVINITSDITLPGEVTLPAGVTLNGNGKQINGTIYAGGDLTIAGHVKVTAFSASYYNRAITIGAGACLEITGGGRVSLAYGNVFNITGNITDAKTADKANVHPSLIIPAGISITGGSDATMNVTNAYVKIGSTSSKNSAADGTFTLNFTNSIAEFTNQLSFAEPTSGKNPTFNVNVKDSVLTTGTKLIIAAPNSNVVIDNSVVTLATYFRNSGNLTLKNGSVLTGATIHFGENGGNDGITTVDNSTLNIAASSAGHALDGKGTGKIIAQNGATVSVDYYKALTVECDAASNFTGSEVN